MAAIDLRELSDLLGRTQALLDNPQPGLATWNAMLHDRLVEIHAMTAPCAATPVMGGLQGHAVGPGPGIAGVAA